ncbi:unnamed protein product [Adineta ricciae]|uniref:Thioesterase domain-containing protein n=1 Tax=Adineta ricciae TaxID=249248 RepID=A0A814KM06_ADIRI|nr:unnamed protein product [Adineta ricciae]CAF1053819.1 unnamed protein product [Adineta ricciae]
MTEQEDIVELPQIPADAPQWVQNLPSNGRFLDRTKFYDITGHLLFDSLLNSNGIRHFYYFVGTEKQTERTNNASSNSSESQDTTSQLYEEVRVAFHLGEGVCGHKGIVHGGLTATMIDEVSGAAAFFSVGPCFTANLNVDYKKPLLTPAWILVRAHVERVDGRKAYIHASVENGEDEIYAEAVVLYIKPKKPAEEIIKQN